VDAGISKEYYDHILAEFTTLDANGDHKLSVQEFKEASKMSDSLGMTALDLKHILKKADADASGEISFKDFLGYMASRKDHLPLKVQVDPQKKRLERNMEQLGMALCTTSNGLRGVPVDGNCQFYSLSWHLFATIEKHGEVRRKVIEHLRGPDGEDFSASYAPEHESLPPTFDGYLTSMSKDRTWGDQLTLQAAANVFNCKVNVLSSDRVDVNGGLGAGGAIQRLAPKKPAADDAPKEFWMSFAAQHYSPIRPTLATPKSVLSDSI